MRVGLFEVSNQRKVLEKLARLVEASTIDPLVRNAALAITHDCDARDDECEVQAVFNAVKTGTDAVEGLRNGLKYMSDPRWADFFTTPARMLKQCASGMTEGDCDDFSLLIAGLLGSLGFVTGLRAWGQDKGEYTHVYAVVRLPKNPEKGEDSDFFALDATVEESYAGWEPPGGYTLTAVLDGK